MCTHHFIITGNIGKCQCGAEKDFTEHCTGLTPFQKKNIATRKFDGDICELKIEEYYNDEEAHFSRSYLSHIKW